MEDCCRFRGIDETGIDLALGSHGYLFVLPGALRRMERRRCLVVGKPCSRDNPCRRGAGALNQYLERNYDAKMKRTEKRPLPSGRLMPGTVLAFGIILSSIGLLELTFAVNTLTGFLGVVTLTTYLFLYTPLKRISPVATTIGGIPGALPSVDGLGCCPERNYIWSDGALCDPILLADAPFLFARMALQKGLRTCRVSFIDCRLMIAERELRVTFSATVRLYFR